MIEHLHQSQFEQLLNLLIFYKQMNPKKKVTLSEKSIKKASIFFNRTDYLPDYPQN
jgi:hypothetical protein